MQKQTFEWTDDMGEISGFGGDYERACRAMVIAGVEWITNNPIAKPKFENIPGVIGIIKEVNDDAKALTEAIAAGAATVDPDAYMTGVMHQKAVEICLWVKRNGWERYCEAKREAELKL